jgi:hypothetical protein
MAQHGIAGVMSVTVIELFEMIDIDHDTGKRRLGTDRASQIELE